MKLRAVIRQGAALGRTKMVEFDARALGKFAVTLADPPWRYEVKSAKLGVFGR